VSSWKSLNLVTAREPNWGPREPGIFRNLQTKDIFHNISNTPTALGRFRTMRHSQSDRGGAPEPAAADGSEPAAAAAATAAAHPSAAAQPSVQLNRQPAVTLMRDLLLIVAGQTQRQRQTPQAAAAVAGDLLPARR